MTLQCCEKELALRADQAVSQRAHCSEQALMIDAVFLILLQKHCLCSSSSDLLLEEDAFSSFASSPWRPSVAAMLLKVRTLVRIRPRFIDLCIKTERTHLLWKTKSIQTESYYSRLSTGLRCTCKKCERSCNVAVKTN